jgi:hypothetical protein
MAPLHHHFEKSGWTETQVVVRFWIITMLLCLVGLATLKLSRHEPPARSAVLVLGLGDSGLAMARWCARHGAHVQVWDSREAPAARRRAGHERAQAPRCAAARCPGRLTWPACRPGAQEPGPGAARSERIAPLLLQPRRPALRWRRARPVRPALADLQAERGYAPKVLAITGTNGKTTTTALCAPLLVERCGLTVARRRQHRPDHAGHAGHEDALDAAPTARARSRCRRCGCWSCRASSSTACRASSPAPPGWC